MHLLNQNINTIAACCRVNSMNFDNPNTTILCDTNTMSRDCRVNGPASDHAGKLQSGPVELISVMTTTHTDTATEDGCVMDFHLAQNAFGQWRVSGGDVEMPFVSSEDLKRFLEAVLIMASGQESGNHTPD